MVVPDPVDPLEVNHPAILPQFHRNPAVSESGTLFHLLLNRWDDRRILDRQPQFVPLRTTRLLDGLTRLPLRNAQLITGRCYGLTLLSRA